MIMKRTLMLGLASDVPVSDQSIRSNAYYMHRLDGNRSIYSGRNSYIEFLD